MPFSDPISQEGDAFRDADRRQHTRQAPGSLSYVHLDDNNGGIVINLSETGLAVQAAVSVMEDDLPRLRLQMPRSKTWLEASARVVWTGDSRRTLGVEFLNSSEDFRNQLHEWLAAEAATAAAAAEAFPPETETHTATVEEIPLRGLRTSPQPRPHVVNPPDFDVAALLTSREMPSVAVARSMKMPLERSHAVSPIATAAKESAPAIPEEHKPRRYRSARYVPLIIVLAALSLGAGWVAGRGNALQTVRALFSPSLSATTSTDARPAASAIANGLATNFEVIDTNNQAWLVPFKGPTSAPAGPALPALAPKAAASLDQPSANPPEAFRASNLGAPQMSARASVAGAGAAPVVATPQDGALPASIAESGPNFSLAPPANGAPAPAVHSSLVPAKLIHTVQPNYPTAALNQHVEGQVKIHARIETDGTLSNVSALSGPPLLISAAVNAVREWKYKPQMLDGRPIASDIVVTLQFTAPR